MYNIFQELDCVVRHYCHGDIVIKKINDDSQNYQNRRSGVKENRIYETYKNTVMPHGRHIYDKSYNTAKATICAYSQAYHALPHWKCVLRCCAKFPSINLPDQETYHQYTDTSPSINFHIYHPIARYTKHGRLPLSDKIVSASVNRILLRDNKPKYKLGKI